MEITNKLQGFTYTVTFNEFVTDLIEEGKNPNLPTISIVGNVEEGNKEDNIKQIDFIDKFEKKIINICNEKIANNIIEEIYILSILENIRSICQSEEEYLLLLEDLKKFFIRDFYASQLDRTGNNFLFKITPDGIRLAPLYDYENSFESIDQQIYRNQIAEINVIVKK